MCITVGCSPLGTPTRISAWPSPTGGEQSDVQGQVSVPGRCRGDHVGVRPAHRCQAPPCSRHESSAVCRHHEGHRPEHIPGNQVPEPEKPSDRTTSWLILDSCGHLEPFQRACSATIPKTRPRLQALSINGFDSNEIGGLTFYGSIIFDALVKSRKTAILSFRA